MLSLRQTSSVILGITNLLDFHLRDKFIRGTMATLARGSPSPKVDRFAYPREISFTGTDPPLLFHCNDLTFNLNKLS